MQVFSGILKRTPASLLTDSYHAHIALFHNFCDRQLPESNLVLQIRLFTLIYLAET